MKLKSVLISLSIAASLTLSIAAFGGGGAHGKETAKIKAPNGGRVITAVDPHAEFLLTAERKIQITFIDHAGKVVPAASQVVTVFTGERSSPTKLSFKKSGDVLLSDGVVPAGDGFATVVQIKPTSDAKPVTAKFNLELSVCSGCGLQEYACTCGH